MTIANVNSGDIIYASKMNEVINGVNGALPLSGGTMTGNIKMSGSYVPSENLHVATKSYVDTNAGKITMPIILDRSIDRELNVFYHNTTGKTAFISVNVYNDGTTEDTVLIRYYYYENPSYAIILTQWKLQPGDYQSYTFLCPIDHWYGVYGNTSKTKIYSWCESSIGPAT